MSIPQNSGSTYDILNMLLKASAHILKAFKLEFLNSNTHATVELTPGRSSSLLGKLFDSLRPFSTPGWKMNPESVASTPPILHAERLVQRTRPTRGQSSGTSRDYRPVSQVIENGQQRPSVVRPSLLTDAGLLPEERVLFSSGFPRRAALIGSSICKQVSSPLGDGAR